MLTDAGRSVKLDGRRGDARARHVAPGVHAALAFVEARPRDVERVLLGREAPESIQRSVETAAVALEWCERGVLERVSGGVPHQGVVALGRSPAPVALEEIVARLPDIVLVLDEVTDPRNVGAILRSAEAAGAGAVVLARDRAPQLTPALVKAAAGAVEWLPLVRIVNVARTLDALRDAGYWVLGLDSEGEASLYDAGAVPGTPVALVLGSEGGGMRPLVRRSCHRLLRIPMLGHTASLNVSVAAAVSMFELRRILADRPVGSQRRTPLP